MARATEKKLLSIPMSGGINQSVDERDAPPGTLTAATNVRVKRSLPQKRPGYSAVDLSKADTSRFRILGDGTTELLEKPTMVGAIGDIPVLATTSGVLWAEHEESGTPWFSPVGFNSTCKPRSQRSHIWDGATGSYIPAISGVAISESGYRATMWTIPGNAQVTVSVVTDEGKPVGIWRSSSYYISTAVIFAQHDVFYVVMGADNRIKLATLTPGSGVLTASATSNIALVGGTPSSGDTITLDVCVISQSRWWLAVGELNWAYVALYDFTGSTLTTNTDFVATDANNSAPFVSLFYDATFDRVWLSYTAYDGGTLDYSDKFNVYLTDGTWTVAGSGSEVHGVQPSCAYEFAAYRLTDVNTESTVIGTRGTIQFGASVTLTWQQPVMQVRIRSQSSSAWVTDDIPGCFPVSRPDNYGRVWVVLFDSRFPVSNNEEAAIFWFALVRLRPPKIDAAPTTISPIIELNVGPFDVICQNGAGINTLSYILGSGLTRSVAQATGANFSSMALLCNLGSVLDLREVSYITAEQDPHINIARGRPTIVTAGQPTEHIGGALGVTYVNGVACYALGGAEIGFAQKPSIVDVITVTPSATETRSYVALFRWADRNGRAHRSAVSLPLEVSSTGFIELKISAPTLGQRMDWSGLHFSPLVEIYVTADGGTTYFFENVKPVATALDATVTIGFSPADSILQARAPVYTDGGVIDNWLAPSCSFMVFTDDRICVGGGFDPSILTYSKIIVPQESIQFTASEAFQVAIPRDVTGLAFIDGTTIAFTRDGIYQITGQGPNDQGIGEFSEPTLIWSGTDCVDYKGVVATQLGVIFQSPQGFYLLPRGLGQPQFIGAAVRSETDAYPTCLGSAVVQTDTYNLARFLMAANGGTSATILLAYDIDRQIWFKDTITLAASELGVWPDDQVVLLRESLLSSSPNALWREYESLTTDAGGSITQTFTTAWIYPFNVGGYGHFRKCQISYELLGASASVTLSVQIDSSSAQTQTWTDTGTAGDVIYHELGINPTQGSCCKVTLTESGASGVRQVYCVLEIDDDGGIRLLDPTLRA